MLNFFINQEQFFKELDNNKYWKYQYNLCWLINIYIILKNLWYEVTKQDLLDQAIKLDAYDEKMGWKYIWLTKLLENYWVKSEIYNKRLFHNYFFKKKLQKQKNNNLIFISSIKTQKENHLIIIDEFKNDTLYYKSVWTKEVESTQTWEIKYNDFIKIYNKRWVIVYL